MTTNTRSHSTFRYSTILVLTAGLAVGSVSPAAFAAAPSSGAIIQQNAPPPALPQVPGPGLKLPTPSEQHYYSTVKVPVRRITIKGNHLIPTSTLEALVQSAVGKKLPLGQLDKVVSRITKAYQKRGYSLAYAYLPAQTIHNGTIVVKVVEPRYDAINIKGGPRLRASMARRTVGVHPGQYINQHSLNRGLLLLNRTPGTSVSGVLMPGTKPGTSSLTLTAHNTPLVAAAVQMDDYGSAYTGRTRGMVNLQINNPVGYGSQVAINGLTTEQGLLHSGGIRLRSPNLWDGLRAGLYGSRTRYRLGSPFEVLDQSGTASQFGVNLSYPAILQPGRLLAIRAGVARYLFDQYTGSVGVNSPSRINLGQVSVTGAYALPGGGVASGDLTVSRGILSLDSVSARLADALGPHTAGHFWLARMRLAQTQPLPWRLHLQATLSGQLASKNLDGAEKFYLGGPYGVMSYPVGEAGGDQGWLFRARVSHSIPLGQLPGRLSAAVLAQDGMVWANRDPYTSYTGPDRTNLAGAGLGLRYTWRNVAVQAAYVRQIGPTKATAGPAHRGEFWGLLRIAL